MDKVLIMLVWLVVSVVSVNILDRSLRVYILDYEVKRPKILRTIIIAMICNNLITGARFDLAAMDAIIEPMINGVWFYVLHKLYRKFTGDPNAKAFRD